MRALAILYGATLAALLVAFLVDVAVNLAG